MLGNSDWVKDAPTGDTSVSWRCTGGRSGGAYVERFRLAMYKWFKANKPNLLLSKSLR